MTIKDVKTYQELDQAFSDLVSKHAKEKGVNWLTAYSELRENVPDLLRSYTQLRFLMVTDPEYFIGGK